MDRQKLTELLVQSSENFNQTKFIPWWEDDHGNFIYRSRILSKETIQEAEACAAECGKEELLSPVGSLGLTLFHLLVLHNFRDAVEKMLCDGRVTGEDVDMPDHKGYGLTSFLLACSRGNLAMVRLLLAHGAKDTCSDQRGMNAYHFLACAKLGGLLAYDSSSLERSAEQRAEIARLLTCDINQKNKDSLTPLEQLLSMEGNAVYTWPLIEVFLDKGARIDYVDEEGNTLLMMALNNDHRTAAFRLMKRCPELVNVANRDGETPVEYTMMYGEDALCFVLQECGAEPADGRSRDGNSVEITALEEITRHAFGRVSPEKRDGLDLALYLEEKLICQADLDDDDELKVVLDSLEPALRADDKARVLDICKNAELSFTQPIYEDNSVTCLRDKCLGAGYRIDILRKLAEWGVDMDTAMKDGRTPAHILASDDMQMDREHEDFYEEAAKLFSRESMEQTDNKGRAAIHLAVKNGHTGMLKTMIEKGVDVNLTEDTPRQAGMAPIHLACMYGRADMVKQLVAAGADDARRNLKGETPAHIVLMREYTRELNTEQRAELLRELKNLDIPGEDGRTPLMLLGPADKELLPLFLERGVEVNHADNQGRTAMMLCMNKDFIKALLQAGADIHRTDNEGNTALHYALKCGAVEEAHYLIRKGIDYNRSNNQGETAAQIAAEKGFETVLDLMTEME